MLTLDLRGLKCPLPVLRTRKAMRALCVGEEIRVVSTDPLAALDIPHMASEDGHALVEHRRDGETDVFVLKKGYRAGPPDAAEPDRDARSTNITVDRPVTS